MAELCKLMQDKYCSGVVHRDEELEMIDWSLLNSGFCNPGSFYTTSSMTNGVFDYRITRE